MIPIDLGYEFPSAVYLTLAGLIILFFCLYLYSVRSIETNTLGSSKVLDVIVESRPSLIFWLKTAGIVLLWISAVIALMGPKGNARYPDEELNLSKKTSNQTNNKEVSRPAHDIIFLIDASASMMLKDTRNAMSRLELAKDIADQVASHLSGENAAVEAFTSELTQLSPLTLDYLFIRMMLRRIQINEGNISGTDYKVAFEELMKRFFETRSQRLRSLILLSDGGDTQYETLEGEAKIQRKKDILSLLDLAEQNHLRVFVVGMGSKQGGDIPEISYKGEPVHSSIETVFLNQIATHGRGEFFDANQMSAVDIANGIIKGMKQDSPYLEKTTMLQPTKQMNQFKVYDFYYQVPLGIAILLLLFVLLFPDVKMPNLFNFDKSKLFSIMVAYYGVFSLSFVEALTVSDLLQEASAFYEAEDYSKSIEIYQDLLDRPLSAWEQAVVHYDLGSAYLASGQNFKALELFKSIQIGENPPPLLFREINVNQAMSYLNESRNIKGNSFDDLNKKFFFLQESLQAIHVANNADCKLQKAEGSLICKPALDLILMEQTIEVEFSALYTQIKIQVEKILATQNESQLDKLLLLYRLVFLGDLITGPSLIALKKEQQLLSFSTSQAQEDNLKAANEWLDESTAAFDQHPKIAQIYLLKAFHALILIQRSFQDSADRLPMTILDYAIEDQREALHLSRLMYELNKEDQFFVDQDLPQNFVLQTANTFLPTTNRYQKQHFINNDRKTPQECCQARPWDVVIPLFDRGYQTAERASHAIGLNALVDQEKALSTWMETKQILSQPVKPHTGSCFASKQAPEEEKNSSKKENKAKSLPKPSFEQIARDLEKMDKEDSSLQPAPIQSVNVERPW